jgi:hypothetical protein
VELLIDVLAQLIFVHAVVTGYVHVHMLGGFPVAAVKKRGGCRYACGLAFPFLAYLRERLQRFLSELASRFTCFCCAGAMMTDEERGFPSLDPFLRPAPSRFPPRAISLIS